ncbi:MAG: HEPN domain-containing protein, partial [Tannerellaceae bacterium]|nr:HEPN domain-containing protein [Tannerellaceae bacterium]
MSHLQDKSKDLVSAANLLHTNKLYPAVAHSAYYCCLQLMKHIWLYSLGKSEPNPKNSLHDLLINEIGRYILETNQNDFRVFNNNIKQLKRLRVKADYSDDNFDVVNSNNSLTLSKEIV